MNLRPKPLLLASAAVAVVVVTAWWLVDHRTLPRPTAHPRPAASARPTPPAPSAAVQPVPTPPPGPAQQAETEATERMYLAHVSLRTPEVADPDSEANRRILDTMVMKALRPPAPALPARP